MQRFENQCILTLGIDPDRPEQGLRQYYASGNVVRRTGPQYLANPFLHEVPRHQVTIDLLIAMGRHEVTREEWFACVEDGGCEQGQRDVAVSSMSRAKNNLTASQPRIHASEFACRRVNRVLIILAAQ